MSSLLNLPPLHSPTTPKNPSSQQQPNLSSAHIDLWEHAALLYHHFEWPSAIETFQHLAFTIPTSAQKARTLCCLNAGIIQARLGDYVLAAQTFESAARTDGDFILTPFLLGIVEWELGNLIKAEACLEISLLALRRHGRDGEVDFFRYGLGFRLRDEVVEEVLRRLRGVNPLSSEQAAQSTIVGVVGLSANYIFEAPPREDELGEFSGRGLEEEEEISPGKKTLMSRRSDQFAESSSKPAVKNPWETLQELKSFLRGHKPIPSTNPPAPGAFTLPPPLRPPQPPAAAEATYHSTWRRRPPTPYIPRDARGEYHSVGELARFIRKYQNQISRMSPRDPRGEAESTGELARFIRCRFPSSSEEDGDRTSDETITLLLPNVYKGTPPKPNNSRPSLQILDRSSPDPGEEGDNPLANCHTAGSETSSLFRHSMLTIERAEVARSEALRRLEGRARIGGKSLRMGVGWGRRAGWGRKREREESEEGMGREEGLRNGWVTEGRRGGSGGGSPPLATTAEPTAAPAAVMGPAGILQPLSNREPDRKGISVIKTVTTTTVATSGKAAFLLPSQSKPLPPGPPRGDAGRFEVFLGEEYQRGDLGHQYGGGGGGGGHRRIGEVGRREEENGEGQDNAIRIPSSKIFEYMSRG
ncbi:hypothetical protein KC357_g8970 [Hortaea werneckii]|nr:hypothetical protein KC342_g6197 [Hortaea werneckii]KAI7099312.1 hypothetical protein KC339_g8314 [Hortaea werneckii]KAI7237285.1 hypothetical protein KC365_g4845 [Hortaea werneckii]KAI7392336.1 hypothetical protein KC328_g7095 [Hortaea werneckii]KAI7460362.1 hypothetical protein KC357_g8970 [Hortaea werneckii]